MDGNTEDGKEQTRATTPQYIKEINLAKQGIIKDGWKLPRCPNLASPNLARTLVPRLASWLICRRKVEEAVEDKLFLMVLVKT